MSNAKVQSWAVAAAYTGECCLSAHVWVKVVTAPTAAAAEAKLRRVIRRRLPDFEIGDVIAIAVPKGRA